ncbi:MAG: IclR family transcriptional regulator [Bryobacterales bacterium]|nr:IclR family transcriptional regulator [Bryobacterales bacterium]
MLSVKTRSAAKPKGASASSHVSSRALAKGLEILDILGAASHAMALGDISSAAKLGKPSTFRLLQTLRVLRYIQQDEQGNYLRGARMPGDTTNTWVQALVLAATEEMARLNADLAETVSLAALMEDHIRVVHTLESPQNIRMSNYPRRILPPYASSLGKAITAYQAPEHAQVLIQVYGLYVFTPKTITQPMMVREDLERTRERGYACEMEETVLGGCCFGAPIHEHGEVVRAAISVSLPHSRLTKEAEKSIPRRVVHAAEEIGKRLASLPAKG